MTGGMRLIALLFAAVVCVGAAAAVPAATEMKSYTLEFGIDPDYMAIDAAGDVWIGDSNLLNRQLYTIKVDGEITPFPLPDKMSGGELAQGRSGAVWFVGHFEGTLLPVYPPKLMGGGPNQIVRIDSDDSIHTFRTNYDQIETIALGPDDRPWFATGGGVDIAEIAADGSVRKIAYAKGANIRSMVLGHDGAMWFPDQDHDRLGRVTPDGALTYFTVTPGGQPTQITCGPNGDLWFAEAPLNKIARMTPAGHLTEYPLTTPDAWPTSPAFDRAGDLWFAESHKDRLARMRPDGSIDDWELPGPHLYPSRVLIDPSGHVWIAMDEEMFRDDPRIRYVPSRIVRFQPAL
jgi:streptogramin lyase